MLKRFKNWLISKLVQTQVIYYPKEKQYPYLSRYSVLGLINRVCINIIYGDSKSTFSKSNNEFHSHTDDFISVILYGSYKETKIANDKIITTTFKPWSINRLSHKELHNLKTLTPKVVTLFFRKKARKYATWYNKTIGEVHEVKYWKSKGFDKDTLRETFEDAVK